MAARKDNFLLTILLISLTVKGTYGESDNAHNVYVLEL